MIFKYQIDKATTDEYAKAIDARFDDYRIQARDAIPADSERGTAAVPAVAEETNEEMVSRFLDEEVVFPHITQLIQKGPAMTLVAKAVNRDKREEVRAACRRIT